MEHGKRMAMWAAPAVVALFLLLHPYQGIFLDARLYTLMALNRLHPDLYDNDIFLRLGSQDDYTLFSPFYGWMIWLFGTEPAAALLTFTGAMVVLAAAWWLARACVAPHWAWIAAGLLAALPTTYGSGGGFAVIEGFVTPRAWAEAATLLALGLWMRGWRWRALACAALAFFFHPLMAFSGAVLLAVMGLVMPHWRRLWPLAALALLALVAGLAGWVPLARWQFDPEWTRILGYGDYLRMANWARHDWTAVTRLAVTLAVAAICLRDRARQLAIGTLLTATGLLLLAWIGGDLLNLALIVQGQAWRVTWIATTVAILLLPAVFAACWNEGGLRRCGALLLAAGWLGGNTTLGLVPTLLALATVAAVPLLRLPQRMAFHLPRIVGVLLAVLAVCVAAEWWISSGGISPGQLGNWTRGYYSDAARQAFAPWRALIPPRSEVLWATRQRALSDPAFVWLVLERPSFFSSIQSTSTLFSRPAAMAVIDRARTIPPRLPFEHPFNMTITGGSGTPLRCAEIPARYIITPVPIADARLIPAPAGAPPPFDQLRLNICP